MAMYFANANHADLTCKPNGNLSCKPQKQGFKWQSSLSSDSMSQKTSIVRVKHVLRPVSFFLLLFKKDESFVVIPVGPKDWAELGRATVKPCHSLENSRGFYDPYSRVFSYMLSIAQFFTQQLWKKTLTKGEDLT